MKNILSWDTPKKARSSAAHAEQFQSDTGVPGTYQPNMSEADKRKWKAKRIDGQDPRVEIRKSTVHLGTQILIKVRVTGVTFSMNGVAHLAMSEYLDLLQAVNEAQGALLKT